MEITEAGKVKEGWLEFYESFTDLFQFFCDNTTIHGTIRMNCSRRNKMKTCFWVFLYFFSFGMMYWQFGDTIHQYWAYPTSITIQLQSQKSIFPAVTVCNLNPYRFSQVNEYLNQLDHLAEETLRTLYGYNATLNSGKAIEIVDLGDIMNNMTIADNGPFQLDKTITLIKINTEDGNQTTNGTKQKVGFKLCNVSSNECYYRSFWSAVDAFHEWYKFHFMNIMSEIPLVLPIPDTQVNKFILTCDFNGALCNSNYSHFHHPTYGSCITIHGNMDDNNLWTAAAPGKKYGLSLILKTDQNDNMPILSSAAGAKVMIHNPDQSPLAEHEGFDILPGTETSISITQDQLNHLGDPYNECTTDGSNLDFQLLYNSSYTEQTCLQSCFQYLMIETCKCGYYFYPLPPGEEYCDYNKHPGWGYCFYQLYEHQSDHKLVCSEKCLKPCSESMYELSAGYAKWPTSVSKDWIMAALANGTGYKRTSQRNDIAKVNVYLQEMNLRSFDESPALTIVYLLSTMGSQWSFWFGSSVLSVVEIAELVFDIAAMLIILRFRKYLKKKEENKNVNVQVISIDGTTNDSPTCNVRSLTIAQVHETRKKNKT